MFWMKRVVQFSLSYKNARLSSVFLLPVFFKSAGSYVLRKVSMTSCPECFDGGGGGGRGGGC